MPDSEASQNPALSGPLRALIAAAAVVIVAAAAKALQVVLIPFLVALLLAAIMRPAVIWCEERGIPQWIAIPGMLLVTTAILVGVGTILTETARQLQAELPAYMDRFSTLAQDGLDWLHDHGVMIPAASFEGVLDAGRFMNFAGDALRGVANVMSTTFLVIILTVFLLIEARGFTDKLAAIWPKGTQRLQATGVVKEIQRYLALKSVMSLATGALITLWVWWIGLDFPLFWGLIAFLFNYVPTVGSIIAAIPALLLALVQLDLGATFMVGFGYLVVNTVIGNFIDPNVLGRGLSLSPLVVILSILFWGWLLGIVGLLLAPVLTMVLRITAENVTGLQWLAVLLGPVPKGDEGDEEERGPDAIESPA
ncbi:MAG: AI-2E family transporter [Longimicrobiales bacterium]|nr:AI-2E family transporter [Longimicrobiales bacterium]